jgi:DNA-binding response OmpR family regulator
MFIAMDTLEQTIFICDANEKDKALLKQVFEETRVPYKFKFTKNGEELLKQIEEFYSEKQIFPRMILLDLNIPEPVSGMETLKKLKSHFLYKTIPVLVLSSEASDKDAVDSYNLGANSFIVKPANLEQFKAFVNTINEYWFKLARLPYKV